MTLDGVAGAPELAYLDVDGTPLASLRGVESLPALVWIHASNTAIDSLAPLAGAQGLVPWAFPARGSRTFRRSAVCRPWDRWDLADGGLRPHAARDPAALESVEISQTAVSDLSPLAGRALRSLWLAETPVTDLSPLASVKTLLDIDVSRTNVTSLAPLSGSMVMLVIATDAALTSLADVHDVPRLRRLFVKGNAISDISSLGGLQPIWIDLRDNPLDAAAPAIIQSLCAAGWAVDWDGGSCGESCLFESCTI